MPDADDFDIESLRALLRGEPPKAAPAREAKASPKKREPGTAAPPGSKGATRPPDGKKRGKR